MKKWQTGLSTVTIQKLTVVFNKFVNIPSKPTEKISKRSNVFQILNETVIFFQISFD